MAQKKKVSSFMLSSDRDDAKALLKAARFGHEEDAAALLDSSDNDTEVCDKNGNTLVMMAARGGHASLVNLFHARGANMSARADNGESILHVSLKSDGSNNNKDNAILTLLLAKEECKSVLNGKSAQGMTPLHCAAVATNVGAVVALLEAGASPAEKTDKGGDTALTLACRHGKEGVAQAVVTHTTSGIDTFNHGGDTGLLLAARHGHLLVARMLVQNGASKSRRDSQGHTPLLLASQGGHQAVAALLLSNSDAFDVEAKNEKGETPLLLAASGTSLAHTAVVDMLLDAGASIDQRTFQTAVCRGHPNTVELLLSRGQSPDVVVRPDEGTAPCTALMWVVENEKTSMLRVFLRAKAARQHHSACPLVDTVLEKSKQCALDLAPSGSETAALCSRHIRGEFKKYRIEASRARLELANHSTDIENLKHRLSETEAALAAATEESMSVEAETQRRTDLLSSQLKAERAQTVSFVKVMKQQASDIEGYKKREEAQDKELQSRVVWVAQLSRTIQTHRVRNARMTADLTTKTKDIAKMTQTLESTAGAMIGRAVNSALRPGSATASRSRSPSPSPKESQSPFAAELSTRPVEESSSRHFSPWDKLHETLAGLEKTQQEHSEALAKLNDETLAKNVAMKRNAKLTQQREAAVAEAVTLRERHAVDMELVSNMTAERDAMSKALRGEKPEVQGLQRQLDELKEAKKLLHEELSLEHEQHVATTEQLSQLKRLHNTAAHASRQTGAQRDTAVSQAMSQAQRNKELLSSNMLVQTERDRLQTTLSTTLADLYKARDDLQNSLHAVQGLSQEKRVAMEKLQTFSEEMREMDRLQEQEQRLSHENETLLDQNEAVRLHLAHALKREFDLHLDDLRQGRVNRGRYGEKPKKTPRALYAARRRRKGGGSRLFSSSISQMGGSSMLSMSKSVELPELMVPLRSGTDSLKYCRIAEEQANAMFASSATLPDMSASAFL